MISVIVPYRDAAPWIGRCVSSLSRQKSDAEFILVNDHSYDSSEYNARAAAGDDKRFIFLHNPTDRVGVGAARNTGIAFATGDWITFLDADDEMMPSGIETYEKLIIEDEEADIHQVNHLRYYAKHDKLALKYTNQKGRYVLDNIPGDIHMWCMVWNKVYLRAMIMAHGIRFNESMRFGEDELFNLECLAVSNLIHHSDSETAAIIRHFDNRGSLSHIKDDEDLILQSEMLTDFLKRQYNPDVRRAVVRIMAEHWGSKIYKQGICGE